MVSVLGPEYYSRSARELAPDMLGKIMCRRLPDGVLRLRVTETECYYGEEDSACHASHGRTKRSDCLYRAGGLAYVYRCHMYYLLTVVTGPDGHPEGVLVRGVEGHNGPGRTGEVMGIVPRLHGMPLTPETGLWFEDDGECPEYTASERIGVGSASAADRALPWRYSVVKK
jgi:DNA-3-methyladenine glycosylase